MPRGTKVHNCVEALMRKGYSELSAIAICQERTGQSYMTGKPLRKKSAKTLGRDFIGIEMEPEYVKIAESRIASVIVDRVTGECITNNSTDQQTGLFNG